MEAKELIKSNYNLNLGTFMAKEIILTIGERLGAINILNAGKFSNEQLASVLDDIKKLAISEEDWKTANLTKTPSDEEVKNMSPEQRAITQQTWKWDEKVEKTLELTVETSALLLEKIREKSTNKELTLQDGALLTLQKKIQ